MGESTINGSFSIAMLVYQRVAVKDGSPHGAHHPVPGQRQDLGPSRTKTRHDGLVSQRRGLPPDCGRFFLAQGNDLLVGGLEHLDYFHLFSIIYGYIPIGSMYAIYIYGNMNPINIPPMLAYIPYMDPMGYGMSSFPLTNSIIFQDG